MAVEVRALEGPRYVPAPPLDPLRTLATTERTRLNVELLAVRKGATWQPAAGRATLWINGDVTDIEPGQRLRAFGQLATVNAPANPGEFDFAARARSTRQLCRLSCEFPECVTPLTGGSGVIAAPARLLARWRRCRVAPRCRAAPLGTEHRHVSGRRDELDPDLRQAFVETGTIHLLVVSGLNVGILAGCLFLGMRLGLVPRGWALALAAIVCVLYAAATDGEPPVVRATVMVLVGVPGNVSGAPPQWATTPWPRPAWSCWRSNPAELFQAGTQLSFLAVGVLVYVAEARLRRPPLDPLDRLIARTRPWPMRIARGLASDFGRRRWPRAVIWLVIAPLVMARFHLVSPVAVLLGPVLALPVHVGDGLRLWHLSVRLAVAAAGGAVGRRLRREPGVHADLRRRLARAGPAATSGSPVPADWWLAGFYWRWPVRGAGAALALAPPLDCWACGRLVGAGLLVSLAGGRDTDRLECTFLSVGHGTAVVVELPGGQTLLYDAGRLGSPVAAARIVSELFSGRAASRTSTPW